MNRRPHLHRVSEPQHPTPRRGEGQKRGSQVADATRMRRFPEHDCFAQSCVSLCLLAQKSQDGKPPSRCPSRSCQLRPEDAIGRRRRLDGMTSAPAKRSQVEGEAVTRVGGLCFLFSPAGDRCDLPGVILCFFCSVSPPARQTSAGEFLVQVSWYFCQGRKERCDWLASIVFCLETLWWWLVRGSKLKRDLKLSTAMRRRGRETSHEGERDFLRCLGAR